MFLRQQLLSQKKLSNNEELILHLNISRADIPYKILYDPLSFKKHSLGLKMLYIQFYINLSLAVSFRTFIRVTLPFLRFSALKSPNLYLKNNSLQRTLFYPEGSAIDRFNCNSAKQNKYFGVVESLDIGYISEHNQNLQNDGNRAQPLNNF